MQHPNIETRLIDTLIPYKNNARTHSKKQIQQIANSIKRFGFTNPVLISDDNEIIAGHGRVMAAKELKMLEVPVLRLSHLSAKERRAYILADNKIAENAGWDDELLAIELQGLLDIDFDLEITGFDTGEIDVILDGGTGSETVAADEKLDLIPDLTDELAVTMVGDLWELGSHKLLCGDATKTKHIEALCNDKTGVISPVAMLFTDPPYNVPIEGHVSGLGRHKHREFVAASGEMSKDEFTQFLTQSLGNASKVLNDGAIAYVCMDWRHMRELMDAGESVFDELKNVCVWNKTNAGMGSFYRSKHELVFVFKKGKAQHINNFGLGDKGRYRTNVWDYAGINSFGKNRDEELAIHPTVKPVNLIADAIRDCSKRGDLILDIFGGSGSTLIAADQSGRSARLLELDPLYCDAIIKRWQTLTGKNAIYSCNVSDDLIQGDTKAAETFEQIKLQRMSNAQNQQSSFSESGALDASKEERSL